MYYNCLERTFSFVKMIFYCVKLLGCCKEKLSFSCQSKPTKVKYEERHSVYHQKLPRSPASKLKASILKHGKILEEKSRRTSLASSGGNSSSPSCLKFEIEDSDENSDIQNSKSSKLSKTFDITPQNCTNVSKV